MGLLSKIATMARAAINQALDKKEISVTLPQPVGRRRRTTTHETAAMDAERCAAAEKQLRGKMEKASALASHYGIHAEQAMAEGRVEEAQRMREMQQHHARKSAELEGQHQVVRTAAAELANAARRGVSNRTRTIASLLPPR